MTSTAVIGHVEWVEFLQVTQLPEAGGLVHAVREPPRAAGSAVVAAVVMAREGAQTRFVGAVGDDAEGEATVAQLRGVGVVADVARRPGPTRRAFVIADEHGERTIVTAGERWAPGAGDDLHWDGLAGVDGVFLTAGDERVFELARQARVLVATPRVVAGALEATDRGDLLDLRVAAGAGATVFDALVFSADDPEETRLASRLRDRARLLVGTEGAAGGRWWGASEGRWQPATAPAVVRDSYGSGDAFAGGFTLGLASGMSVADAASLGARSGAEMLGRVGAP